MSHIEIAIASTPHALLEVYRFRYQVYVREMGRTPPQADHGAKLLKHTLDDTAANIVAYDGGAIVGVIRNNLGVDSSFGCFLEFYGVYTVGMDHPDRTSITSGLMVESARRGGMIGARLASASYDYGLSRGIRWNFIDCVPPLVPFFKAFGWVEHLPEATHPEYAFTVRRMRLDLEDASHLARVGSPLLERLRSFRRAQVSETVVLDSERSVNVLEPL